MFSLKTNYTYFWPVKIETPKSGGSYTKEEFEAEFRLVSQSRIKEILGISKPKDGKQPTDNDFCKEIMVGWKNVKDESGEDLTFSQHNLELILEVPGVAKKIVTAYLESFSGAEEKN